MKYFKKIDSFKDLKNKYRELLKANHPDNGGNVDIMSEINCEYDALFKIWKDKTPDLTEEEKNETASGSRRNFYTAFGWAGSRYDSKLTLKEIASICRNYVKTKYPTCKFSIRTHYASMCQSLSVELKEFPAKMYKTADDLRAEGLTELKTYINGEGKEVTYQEYTDEVQDMLHRLRVNGYFDLDSWYDNDVFEAYEKALNDSSFYGIKTEYFKSVIDDVNSFVQSYNYNDSDSMTDYFDVNFYDGKVDYSECKQVEKVARVAKKETAPATTEAPAGSPEGIETSGEAYTVEESTHTKTGEKIYLVKWLDHLDRGQYIELNNAIKKIGGYYSRFTHSFIFKEDPTNLLINIKIA